jgi:hypothetical protein
MGTLRMSVLKRVEDQPPMALKGSQASLEGAPSIDSAISVGSLAAVEGWFARRSRQGRPSDLHTATPKTVVSPHSPDDALISATLTPIQI